MSTPANLNFGWDALSQLLTVNGGVLFGPAVGPYFSLPNTGRIYYDGPSNRLKASENGGAPVNLLTGGGGGGSGTVGQVAFFDTPSSLTSEITAFGWDTTNKFLNVQGHSAFGNGSTPLTTEIIDAFEQFNIMTDDSFGMNLEADFNPIGDTSFSGIGLQSTAATVGTFNFTADLLGLVSNAIHGGIGIVSALEACQLHVENLSTGTITTATGLSITTPVNSGTIVNNYGLEVQDQSSIGTTASVNIISRGTSSQNQFQGSIEVGTFEIVDGSSAPALSSVGTGRIYFDSGSHKFKASENGGAYVNLISAGGTVTSVAMTGDGTVFNSSVPGSPITTSGTLAPTLHTQANNTVLAGPNGGGPLAPTFRSLVAADLPAGTGTVTSVAATVPVEFSISGSPITTAGTLAITKATEPANTVWAGPTTGAATQPTFRSLVNADLPTSGVSAGSYTNTNLTVNAQGIITAASNGSGGGGGTDISVQAKDGTTQTIGTSFTAVTFAAENFDTDNMHSTVTNTSRLTCNTSGKFQLHFAGAATRGSGAAYYVELRLRLNGTTTLHQTQHLIQPEASQLDETVEISLLTNLVATDYVEVLAMQSSTGFAFDGGNIPTIFEAVRQPG